MRLIKHIASILGTSLVLGLLLGAVTNLINVRVAPAYFHDFFSFGGDVTSLAVAQGLLEGAVLGVLLGVAVIVVDASRRKSDRRVARLLVAIACGSFALWLVGGVVGALIGLVSPEFYMRLSSRVDTPLAAISYGWVGGSIVGIELGSLAATLLGCILHWRDGRTRLASLQPTARG